MIDSLFTYLALAIPPIVTAIFVAILWIKREPAAHPSIAAAIPLELSAIAILLAQSAMILLATFQEIATRQTASLHAVIAGLLRAQRPLIWGCFDLIASLLVIVLVSFVLRYRQDSETPLLHAYIALPALLATAVSLVGLFLIASLQYGTVDLVMMIVDNHRNHELIARFGMVNPGYFAATISSRLVLIFFLSIALFAALLTTGVLSFFWRQKENARQAFATALTLGAFAGCGMLALSELGFVSYLRHVH